MKSKTKKFKDNKSSGNKIFDGWTPLHFAAVKGELTGETFLKENKI